MPKDMFCKLTTLAIKTLITLEGFLPISKCIQVNRGVLPSLTLLVMLGVVVFCLLGELLPFLEISDERGHLLRHLGHVMVKETEPKLVISPELIPAPIYRILQLLHIDSLVLE